MLTKPYAGQKVQLKSGGPIMTVGTVCMSAYLPRDYLATCSWFDSNKLDRGDFLAACLNEVRQ